MAADPTQADVVFKLRTRKRRDVKPFAVMARNVETAARYCEVSRTGRNMVDFAAGSNCGDETKKDSQLSRDAIHPGIDNLGVMLPYTPLHFLLFDDELKLLIMTSANISDEPLITDNREIVEKLSDVADFFLVHNREIFNSCDDSVLRITPQNTPQFFRRARGYVPMGIRIPASSQPVFGSGRRNEKHLLYHPSG